MWLVFEGCQLRRIRKSLDKESTACACLCNVSCWLLQRCLRGAPQTVSNRLHRVMIERYRPSCKIDTGKFDRRLKAILHDELHWLDVHERIEYKLGLMVYRCLHRQAPRYIADYLIPASDTALAVVIYDLPTGTVSLCLAVDSARTAVERSTTPARQSGTRCQTNLEIPTVMMVLNGS